MAGEGLDKSFYLAIDGGGTACRARLYDAGGAPLGMGLGGAANIASDFGGAIAAILAASAAAVADAALPSSVLACAHAGLGLAGANVPEAARAVLAHPFPFASLCLASDSEIACLGAHAGEDGAILILGTGSQGLVIQQGKTHKIGGFGFLLSDGASGAVLGLRAVRRALLTLDALAPSSPLTAEILARFDDDLFALLRFGKSARPKDWAELAPLIFHHAARGDAAASGLLAEAVEEVEQLLARLFAFAPPRLALMGGLAGSYLPHLREETRARLAVPLGDALDGALLLAREKGKERVFLSANLVQSEY